MGVGRFLCVALPFILTAASLICLLIGGLAGVTNTGLYAFQVNTTNLSISPLSVQSLIQAATNKVRDVDVRDTASDVAAAAAAAGLTRNVTAADLGLANSYDVSIWGFCSTSQAGERTCTKAKFDWASSELNTSTLSTVGSIAGYNITLPKEIETSLNAFKQVAKWTQVAFIIAYVALALELFVGIFATCSRGFSCLTWLVSGIATFFVIAAAAMATAMSSLVVGAVEGTAKFYGVEGSLNTSFLAVIWMAAAFAIGAGLFWLFTICCCKPEHRASSRKRHLDDGSSQEKFVPANSYQPLNEPAGHYSQSQYGFPRHHAGGHRSESAYEPYSHGRV